MCGIAGVLYRDPSRPVAVPSLRAMAGSLAHRGPDGEGLWRQPGIGLTHRRLAIIDLAGGDQPMANEDGSVQVVCNGEIYNYRELRRELLARNHQFRSASDTEVLAHLYEELGERLVERLRGMFALAIWDARRRRLLLARDRVGLKPLYLFRTADRLLFASELKAILADPSVPRVVDPAALEDYLAYGMVPGDRSIFQGVTKLPAGHTLLISAENWDASPRRYWRLQLAAEPGPTLDDWCDAVESKVREAVRLHLVADVPVGAFLSGGIDSSIVVACAAKEVSQPLQTFAMGFREARFSELPFARLVAERFTTLHREEIVTPDAVGLLDELVHFYDEPFADSSALPTFLLSRLASRHVKVVLSGDGGDEVFGGYARYAHDLREAALRQRLPMLLRKCVLAPLARRWPKADWLPRPLRAKTMLTNLSLESPAAYANTLAFCRQPLRRQLLAAPVAAELNGHRPEQLVVSGFEAAPRGDPLAGMLSADLAMVLPDDFLVKVDRASMAHGLEVRPPLLDHELLELAAKIPSHMKVHRGQTKRVLKKAFQSVLPPEIVDRPKHGFEVPVDAWLRGPLRPVFEDSVLAHSQGAANQLLNLDRVRQLQADHLRGIGRHGAVLWSVLVLARWAEAYLKTPLSTSTCS
jgi:asparagine synthase (glutamine-hydrolysing)